MGWSLLTGFAASISIVTGNDVEDAAGAAGACAAASFTSAAIPASTPPANAPSASRRVRFKVGLLRPAGIPRRARPSSHPTALLASCHLGPDGPRRPRRPRTFQQDQRETRPATGSGLDPARPAPPVRA